jgi:probable F420-dependent oxidoreductase
VQLGPIGLWTFHFDQLPPPRGRELAHELEALGYAALWFPEAVGRDALVAATLALDATERIAVGTGIAPIYGRDPVTCNSAWQTVSAAFPDRFVLGLGVSHKPSVEGLHKVEYGPPVTTMRKYLDEMDAAPFFAVKPERATRVLAALGPKMLALASERADGALPYNVTPAHTKMARGALGPGKLLAVEQKAVLTADVAQAREVARRTLAIYLGLPNYVNNWRRLGFDDDDFTSGGSDRLLDAMVVHGDEAAVKARVDEHLAAGADHVCVQVLDADDASKPPLDGWRRLAQTFF